MLLSTEELKMNRKIFYTTLLLVVGLNSPAYLVWVDSAEAIPASPDTLSVVQPDGKVVLLRVFGDEFESYLETLDGYTVLKDSDGYWKYAIRDQAGILKPSDVVVGIDTPTEAPHLRSGPTIRQEILNRRKQVWEDSYPYTPKAIAQSRPHVAGETPPVLGTRKILVICIDFSDQAATTDISKVESAYFGESSSMKAYYKEVSYGKLTVTGNVGGRRWVRSSQPLWKWGADTGPRDSDPNTNDDGYFEQWELAKDAVLQLDATGFDFSPYDTDGDRYIDHIAIVVAGQDQALHGSEPDKWIWPHRWFIFDDLTVDGLHAWNYTMVTEEDIFQNGTIVFGTLAHEFGHDLWLPDLYDRDGSSAGIGYWGLMGAGAHNIQSSPAHMCAWSKIQLGWITPTVIPRNQLQQSIPNVEETPVAYKLPVPSSKEYFLVENRQPKRFDRHLRGTGLLIWHVDEGVITTNEFGNTVNDNENHPGLALEQADGRFDLKSNSNWGDVGDPWPGTFGKRHFNNTSVPSSRDYSGKTTGIAVENIGNSSDIMRADLIVDIVGNAPILNSFKINNRASITRSRTVTLNNTATNSPTHYMASVRSSFLGANWETYSTSPSFTLSSRYGTKRVYFKVKNAGGESNRLSDTIEYSQDKPTLTSFAINNRSPRTTSRTVILNNAATNSPTHYKASENSNFSGATWRTYSKNPSFTLSPGYGQKLVRLKVKNATGESTSRIDVIQYVSPFLLETQIVKGELTHSSRKFADSDRYYNSHVLDLSKGQKVSLTVEPSSKFMVGLWDTANSGYVTRFFSASHKDIKIPNDGRYEADVTSRDEGVTSPYTLTVEILSIRTIKPILSESSYNAGEEFWVDIRVDQVSKLFGTSFELNYTNTDYVDVVVPTSGSIVAGTFLGDAVVFYSNVNETEGKIGIAISQKFGASGADGRGVLARVNFKALLNTPDGTTVNFSLVNVIANDTDGTSIPLTSSSASVTIRSTGLVEVWPGDTNDNGMVNQADVLPIALYWGVTGPNRTGASNAWNSQNSQPWTPGDATYANANGDGTIDQGDVLPIGLNWGKRRSVAKITISDENQKSPYTLEPVIDSSYANGEEFWIDLKLDQETQPDHNLLGISFLLSWDLDELIFEKIEPGALMGSDVVLFSHREDKTLAVGISRKSGQGGIDENGVVLRVKMHSPLASNPPSSIQISVTDVLGIDVSGNEVAINSKSSTLPVNYLPEHFALHPNFPNPFNPETTIRYDLPFPSHINLSVYNMSGQRVALLVDKELEAGTHSTVWDGKDDNGKRLANGVYLYRMESDGFVKTRKMVLMK